MRRVVVTGMGAVTPFGVGVAPLAEALARGASAVQGVPELAQIGGLRSRVAALVPPLEARQIPRKFRRSMTPMSVYATLAAYEAVAQAALPEALVTDGRLGVSVGATLGSTHTTQGFFEDYFTDRSLERMKATLFFQIMGHSSAANVAQALGVSGRVVSPSAACTTGCQAVGLAFEAIAAGRQDRMLCGGADEFHPLVTATFDVMNAASLAYNDRPAETPRPFDRERDGVVCGEGAGIVLLEAREEAGARGARVLAEVLGFATTCDPANIAHPAPEALEACMRQALADAGVEPREVDHVSAHATGTPQGDAAEAQAIARVFGPRIPVASLKGHLGHTMAASGAVELVGVLEAARRGFVAPTRNLVTPGEDCGGVRHLQAVEAWGPRTILKNSFAMGGVNSCIVVRRERS